MSAEIEHNRSNCGRAALLFFLGAAVGAVAVVIATQVLFAFDPDSCSVGECYVAQVVSLIIFGPIGALNGGAVGLLVGGPRRGKPFKTAMSGIAFLDVLFLITIAVLVSASA